ncbi:hypothetical protein DLH72_00250 [Candidatus Gracilibacteria bacterium]|nr:MAG: hypothetical protein DLH72_00250 [Candidatus Gracilibacteria bacterium]
MSIMYNYTRQEAADFLGISTRSIDRYIKSGKLRSKKEGKIVYVNDDDVKNMSGNSDTKHEIIDKEELQEIKKSQENNYEVEEVPVETKEIELKTNFKTYALDKVYDDLRAEIKQKDEVIQDLSIKLGRAEEIVKNSVSMIDFKRSQMLLEDSKTHLGSAISELKSKNEILEKDLKHEKTTKYILFITVLILFIISLIIWGANI